MDTILLAQELRQHAAEAIRIAALVPEGTRDALQKIAAELLATAATFEATAAVVVAPQEVIEETRTSTDPKAET